MDSAPPTVDTAYGPVRGTYREGVRAFLGIPYAAPPVGRARFEAPRAPEGWTDPRDGTAHGAAVLQAPYPPPMDHLLPSSVSPPEDGDALTVSVWTPEGAAGLPVLVWIHGGAFVRGASSVGTYDGSAFARDRVVFVSLQYRLGAAGFAEVERAPTNRGLRDQVFALEWVRDNVATFGGDPGRVTIMGESAGAMSVADLVASPAASGLFHRAICQSGGANAVCTRDDARRVAAALAEHLGVEPTIDGLADVPPADLLAAQTAVALAVTLDPDPARWGASVIQAGLGVMTWFPCLDDDLIPALPLPTIATGPAVPMLTGTTSEEFRLFTVPTGLAASITSETLTLVLRRYGLSSATHAAYAAARPGASPGDVVVAMLTDAAFTVPMLDVAAATTAAGQPAYVYEFSWQTTVSGLGACHALELAYVFDTLPAHAQYLLPDSAPQALADLMHAAWVAFARDGDPGWPAWTPDHGAVQRFDVDSTVVHHPRAAEIALWR
ncbi:MAG: carboxylesterase family protein [Nostocoides sp.]